MSGRGRGAHPPRPPHRHPSRRPPPPATLSQELTEQAHLAGPLALNLIANYRRVPRLAALVVMVWRVLPLLQLLLVVPPFLNTP